MCLFKIQVKACVTIGFTMTVLGVLINFTSSELNNFYDIIPVLVISCMLELFSFITFLFSILSSFSEKTH